MVIIYNFLSFSRFSFLYSYAVDVIVPQFQLYFRSLHSIFLRSLYIGQRWVVSFFQQFFLIRWFLAMITFIEIRMGNVHLHSTRLCYLIVVLLLLFFLLHCEMWVSLAHCSELQVLNDCDVDGQFRLFKCEFSSILWFH